MNRASIRHQYWDFLADIQFQIHNCEHYEAYAKRCNTIISVFSLTVSSSSIAAWGIWSQYATIWGLLVATGQLLHILQPYFSFSRRLTALRFYLPELRLLAVDVEKHWNISDDLSEEAFAAMLAEDKKRSVLLESKFVGDERIPSPSIISKRVLTEWKLALESYEFNSEKGGEPLAAEEDKLPLLDSEANATPAA